MKLDKILKTLPESVVQELDALPIAELNSVIAQAEEAISTAIRERDANPKYQEAKESCKALSEGMREVKTYQRAKIEYSLHRRRELNGDT